MTLHASEPHDMGCVVHVHSTYSDGTATVPEIIDAARASGADAVLLTDHDTLQAKRDGWEGWHDGVLVLVGIEVSPRGGHFLAFGIDREPPHAGRTEAQIAQAVAAAGGLGFPAHPFSQGSRISRTIGRPHPWSALEDGGYTGIELWSLVTDTAERCATPRELLRFLRAPAETVTGPPAQSLAAWDRLCARRRVVAIGGLDAHQTGLRFGQHVLTVMPHARVFGTLRTRVLLERAPTGELEHDRAALYAALAAGRCYLALEDEAPARGFAFWASGSAGRLEMGDEAAAGDWTLHARLPEPAQVRLVRDGTTVERADGARELTAAAPEAGVYRLEAWRTTRGRERAWIISNPIYLRDAG